MARSFTPGQDPNLAQKEDHTALVSDIPRGNFQFAYHPDDWQLDAESTLIPVVVHVSKTPGCNGVDEYGNFDQARLNYERNGYKLISHDILPSGYVAPYRNKKRQMVHRTVFQRPTNIHGATHWTHDAQAWRGFIKLLRKKGAVEQPRPAVLQSMIAIRENMLRAMVQPRVDDSRAIDAYNARVDKIKRDLATLTTELESAITTYGAPEAPARSVVDDVLAELAALDEPTPDPKPKQRRARKPQP